MKKQIIMVIAQQGFRDEELEEPKRIFEKQGYDVVVSAPAKGVCKGMLGTVVEATMAINELSLHNVKAVVVVGGVQSPTLMQEPALGKLLAEAKEKKILIGAICLAPMVVASFGVITGMHATVYKTKESLDMLKKHHVAFLDEPVVVDDWLITGNGPDAAEQFAKNVLDAL